MISFFKVVGKYNCAYYYCDAAPLSAEEPLTKKYTRSLKENPRQSFCKNSAMNLSKKFKNSVNNLKKNYAALAAIFDILVNI